MKSTREMTNTILSVLVGLLVITACDQAVAAFTPSEASQQQLKGDIDNSGTIAIQDAIMVFQIAAGMNAGDLVSASADVSGDNKIGIAEAIYILQCMSGIRSCENPDDGACVWDGSTWDSCLWGQ